MIEVLKKPKRDRERRELIDWLGEEFDPVCFDVDVINEKVHQLPIDRRVSILIFTSFALSR